MGVAAAMFNTLYEAEGAVQSLRGADVQNIEVIARERNKREVFVDDIVTRKRNLFDDAVEAINVTDRLTSTFQRAISQSDFPNNALSWFQQWLNDGYVLVVAYLEDGVGDATAVLIQHGGVLCGAGRETMSSFPDQGKPLRSAGSPGLSTEGQQQRPAA